MHTPSLKQKVPPQLGSASKGENSLGKMKWRVRSGHADRRQCIAGMIAETVTIDILKIQSINQSINAHEGLSPMWEVALMQQEFLENNVITQFIIYNFKQNL